MVRVATKYDSHVVSVGASYSNVAGGAPNQPYRTDRGNFNVGLGGQNWADLYLHWQGYGYITADNGTDWGGFFSDSCTNFSMGLRRWAVNCIAGTNFSAKYEFKFSPVYTVPAAGETPTTMLSAKIVVDNVPLVLFGSGGSGVHDIVAGNADFLAGLVKGIQPFPEYDFWPLIMVALNVDGTVGAQYALTQNFNNEIALTGRIDSVMTYKGDNKYELFAPAYVADLSPVAERWLYTIEPSNVKPAPASYSREKIELSDAADNALFNDTTNPPWYYPGASAWQGWTVTANPYGYLVTVDKRIGGTRQRKFWQFSQDWDRYREIILNGTDANAVMALDLGSDTTGLINMDDTGNIAYVPQGGTPFDMAWYNTYAGPTPAIPDWGASTGTTAVRTWTFTLDSHDMYVLRLGQRETLVYDAKTGQWPVWDSLDNDVWAVNTGFSWVGGLGKGPTNVVVGDDTTGNLYWLDPEQVYDHGQTPDFPDQYFKRVASTYVPIRGRDAQPCYDVILTADTDGLPGRTMTLEYSDDQGKTFISAGTLTLPIAEYSWNSLGQIVSPGRIFKLTDDGAAQRLDGLEMNDGQ